MRHNQALGQSTQALITTQGPSGVQVLEGKLDVEALEGVTVSVPDADEDVRIGRRSLRCLPASTPRYPDMLCVYERSTRRLFSSCFFSAHVLPQSGSNGLDAGGWGTYSQDWEHFFSCMFAPCVKQAESAVQRLRLGAGSVSASPVTMLAQLGQALFGKSAGEGARRPVAMILPRHGPVIRQSAAQLILSYRKCEHLALDCLHGALMRNASLRWLWPFCSARVVSLRSRHEATCVTRFLVAPERHACRLRMSVCT